MIPPEFTLSYAGPKTCELFANPAGKITLYIPKREGFDAALELGTDSYVTAEAEARKLGFYPNANSIPKIVEHAII